jgi:antitoxin component YwqK of YwqJK toxin-antitoxin module
MLMRLIYLFLLVALASCNSRKQIEIYYESGKIMERFQITRDSIKDGMYQSWFEDGKLYEEASYSNGKLVGERKIYYPNGQQEILETYNDKGELNGPYKSWYENGNLKTEQQYADNVLQGILKSYYPNGKLKEQVTMKDNQENGAFTEYYPNGQISWKGTYLHGDNEFGLLENYDSLGVLIRKMNCDSNAICRTIWKKEGHE